MEQKRRNFRDFDNLYIRYGERLRFPVYLGQELMEAPIEDLELSVRSYNCLKRTGMTTVGELIDSIENRTDLLRIRNLGIRSADEIMTAIMEFQYSLLSEAGRPRYLQRIEELNSDQSVAKRES